MVSYFLKVNKVKKIILFSPNGYVGGFIKERLQKEQDVQLYEITRDNDLQQYVGSYDVMVYSASVSCATAEKYVQDNVVTAIAIMNFCKKHNVQRVIYLSSDSIYGELNVEIVTSKAIMINPGLYGTTKYLAERIIMESGIPYYILRMPGIVGRIYRKGIFIQTLIDRIRENQNIELYNINRKFNNILDVDDLVKFIWILSNNRDIERNAIFLLGNMEAIELGEVVSYIKSLYHSSSAIKNIETNEKKCFMLDVSEAVKYGYTSKKIRTILNELYQIREGGI